MKFKNTEFMLDIEKIEYAIELCEHACDLLDEAYRSHLKTSYSINFDNLVDKNGDTIEIDLGDEYKPICVELMEIGRKARASGERIQRSFDNG